MADPSYRLRAPAWEVLKSLLSLLLALKEWIAVHWPDVQSSGVNADDSSDHVSRIGENPMVDTTSMSGESTPSPCRTRRKSYTYYKTAGRSSSSSGVTQKCTGSDEQYFAVCIGTWPGIYPCYADCCKAMEGHDNPIFMKFSSREDAEWFLKNGHDFVPRCSWRF